LQGACTNCTHPSSTSSAAAFRWPRASSRGSISPIITSPSSKRPRRKTWLFRLATAVVVPLLALSLLEGLLRLVSFGYPTSFYLRTKLNEREVIIENARFGRRFFTPPELARKPLSFVLPAQKSEGTYRIFLLGESAAMGDPNPSFGCARMLERMLGAEYPGVRFEVINAGMVAINSHVIRHIARDVAQLQPDAFIIYMGNNEVVGPYGPGTAFYAFSPSLAAIRAGIAMRGTRIGQALDVVLRYSSRAKDRDARWNGMQQFLEHRIAADDPRLAAAYRHFERNLRDMVHAGTTAGARVVLCTVGVNLRASPPFGATEDANAAFREAKQLEAAGRYEEAKIRYGAARDLDTLRFRADAQINAAIRRVAGELAGLGTFVDAEALFARAAEHGIPGNDLFLEHVHMNFHGNFVLASAIRDTLAGQFPANVADRRPLGARLTERDCARLLAFTAWNRFAVDEDVYRRLGTPPFSFQLDHDARAEAMASDLESRRESTGPAGLAQARKEYAYAIDRAPEDWMLHQNFGDLLLASGYLTSAMREYRRVFELIPQAAEPYMRDAFALADRDQPEEAVALILTHNPDRPRSTAEAYDELGNVFSANGDHARAAAVFKKAVNLAPSDKNVRYKLAMALGQQNRRPEAIEEFTALLAIDPDNADAHYNLAMALAGEARWDEAVQHLERVVEVDPEDTEAKAALDKARDGAARRAAATPPAN